MTENMSNNDISDDLNNYTNEELKAKIKSLQIHNLQLRNIIAKGSASSQSKQLKKYRRPFDFDQCKFRHVLLKFFYIGWDYNGYASQEDTPNTIENELFKALQKTCLIKDRQSSNYHRCGRTDKGVSAFSQVISIDLRSISCDTTQEINYCKILNRLLPSTIQCIAWCPVSNEFSARFDCQSRTYRYFFPKADLNIHKMREAAQHLIGTHDFRNFCKMDVGNGVVEFVRNINSISITEFNSSNNFSDYSVYVIEITSKAFLWHQIRCLMGILFLIGRNKEQPDLVIELLDVKKNPRKPDYNLANELPLILYNTMFKDIAWIYEKESVGLALRTLQNQWAFTQIKCSMLQSMLRDLHQQTDTKEMLESSFLIQGARAKNYIPVMKRQLCDSLEDKVEKKKKRGKIS